MLPEPSISPFPTRSVFLLAGHKPPDWRAAYSPYLAPVGRLTLIERLIAQIQRIGSEPYVVSTDQRLIDLANLYVCPKKPNPTFAEQIYATKRSWRNRVYILRADAYYTEWAMDTIFSTILPSFSFGPLNVWGFSFRRDCYEDVLRGLEDTLEYCPSEPLMEIVGRIEKRGVEMELVQFVDGSFQVKNVLQLMECQEELKQNYRRKRR